MLLVMFMRSDPAPATRDEGRDDESSGGGGGGSDRRVPRAPQGPCDDGLPLAHATRATRRLREPGRLGDEQRPLRRRRQPAYAPQPERERERERERRAPIGMK